jgi:hypothetical protein
MGSVNIGGTWKDLVKPSCNIGGTWKDGLELWTNIGGVWKKCWEAVNPSEYIYVGGYRKVQKFHIGNLAYISQSADYGGTILCVAIDSDYIYVGGYTTQKVQKFHIGNLAYVGQTAGYGGNIYAIALG